MVVVAHRAGRERSGAEQQLFEVLYGVGGVVRLVGEVHQQYQGGDDALELLRRVVDELGVAARTGAEGAVVEADDVLAAPLGAQDTVVLAEGDAVREAPGRDQVPVFVMEFVQRVR